MSGESPKSEASQPTPAAGNSADNVPAPEHAPAEHSLQLPQMQWLLAKLKQHHVGRVALLYVGVCYLILEPFEMFFHLLELPAWTGRAVVLLMVLGFPVTLLLARVWQIKPTAPTSSQVDQQSSSRQTGRKLDRAIIVVLAAALVYFVADKFFLSKHEVKRGAAVVSETGPSGGTRAPPAISEKSVAVLPFVDMSEKHDQEYFSDGLSEELIDKLTKVVDLRVPARTSSFYFKGKQTTIGDVAKALSVAYVLEGSVRKSGKTLRITAQLIKTDAGFHVWSQTYDRPLDDVFKLQDEIAEAVVSALKVSLMPGAAASTNARDIEANDLYLQALFLKGHQLTEDNTKRSVELLSRALKLDPTFAPAWAELSRTKLFQAAQGLLPAEQTEDAKAQARVAAEKATALDPSLPEGHVALGRVYLYCDQDLAKATAEYRRALILNPRSGDAMLQLGSVAEQEGRLDEGVRLQEQALAMDPLNINILDVLGTSYLAVGRTSAAETIFRRQLELSPQNMFAKTNMGIALALLGRPAEALDFMERGAHDESERNWARAMMYPALGRKTEADALLAALERDPGSAQPLDIAEVYAYHNDRDRAFKWLERQYAVDPGLLSSSMHSEALLANLRGDPRFKVLLRKLKLPE